MATWTKQSKNSAPTWSKQTENTQQKFGGAFGFGAFGSARFGTPKDGWTRKQKKTTIWTKQTEN